MYYGEIKKNDVANGIGIRVTLFVSGCTHRCKGCFNEATWDFSYGNPFTEETEEEILSALSPDYVAGFTLLGGEPFEPQNQKAIAPLLEKIKERYPHKTIWCFTGYVLEKDLLNPSRARCEHTDKMLSLIDVLIDGPFIEAQRNLTLKFRGSENQRLIDLKSTLKEGEIVLWEN